MRSTEPAQLAPFSIANKRCLDSFLLPRPPAQKHTSAYVHRGSPGTLVLHRIYDLIRWKSLSPLPLPGAKVTVLQRQGISLHTDTPPRRNAEAPGSQMPRLKGASDHPLTRTQCAEEVFLRCLFPLTDSGSDEAPPSPCERDSPARGQYVGRERVSS